MYTIGRCSQRVFMMIDFTKTDKVGIKTEHHGRTKYPFDQLAIGEAFAIPLTEAKETSIRIQASKKGKQLGKRFTVMLHSDIEVPCYEVARIA